MLKISKDCLQLIHKPYFCTSFSKTYLSRNVAAYYIIDEKQSNESIISSLWNKLNQSHGCLCYVIGFLGIRDLSAVCFKENIFPENVFYIYMFDIWYDKKVVNKNHFTGKCIFSLISRKLPTVFILLSRFLQKCLENIFL